MPDDRPDEKKPPVQEPPPKPEDKTIRAGNEDEPFDVPTRASIGSAPLSDLDDENHEKRKRKTK